MKKIFLFLILVFAFTSIHAQTKDVEMFEAAQKGDPQAQHMVGAAYALGLGVKKDYAESLVWYHKAADQGYAPAMSNIGYCYKNATGVEQDMEQAAFWFRKAAEKGHPDAQMNLGKCYYYGAGVSKDLAEAIKWWEKAVDNKMLKPNICWLLATKMELGLTLTNKRLLTCGKNQQVKVMFALKTVWECVMNMELALQKMLARLLNGLKKLHKKIILTQFLVLHIFMQMV